MYPNREQERRMLNTIEACRHLWNDALSHRKRRWEEERKSTTYNLQQWILTAVRKSDTETGQVYSQVAQDVLNRLDKSFKSFFSGNTRYPKFKEDRGSGSFTYPQAYNGSVKPDPSRKRLFLSKLGNIKTIFHIPIPRDSVLKTCTITRESCDEWYASLNYEDIIPLQGIGGPSTPISRPIGVDLGLKALMTTSDVMEVLPPKFLRQAENRLRRLQESLTRKKKGSKNRWKARTRVATQHAKVARQRKDTNHKLSNRLVNEHDLIGFEDLHIGGMVRNYRLAKSILDAGWGQLVEFTEYKAVRLGIAFVKVSSMNSTRECFFCGSLNEVTLDMREFNCVGCGRLLKRDLNGARNVLKRALKKVGQGRRLVDVRLGDESRYQGVPELKPVETRTLLVPANGRAIRVFESGTRKPIMGNWDVTRFSAGRHA